MKAVRAVGIQYAALPYRLEGSRVMVLLITSRATRRWVIPKGWPIRGLKPQDATAVEAAEEAGVVGEIEGPPLGSYRYEKLLKPGRTVDVQVIVFPFRVSAHADAWKEQHQREARWFPHQRAAALVGEPALRRIILEFGAARAPTLLARSLRTYRWYRSGRPARA